MFQSNSYITVLIHEMLYNYYLANYRGRTGKPKSPDPSQPVLALKARLKYTRAKTKLLEGTVLLSYKELISMTAQMQQSNTSLKRSEGKKEKRRFWLLPWIIVH